MPHLLIVDDEQDIRSLIADIAQEQGFSVAEASDIKRARIQIDRQKPDVILMDMLLPDGDGMEFWESLNLGSTHVVFITGHSTIESAIQALRCGAVDYLRKPLRLQRLKDILGELTLLHARGNGGDSERYFAHMIGESAAMLTLREHIERVAPTRATVLLVGESGTGKELAARAVHLASVRHEKQFIPVNCGAVPPNLIESELFGHEKGSFTGADRQHRGFFERADGGTLFLDEITEMPMELQVRLLRVLENGTFMRVGSQKELSADVRIVAATNRDPEEAVSRGLLRADLYHRLSVFPLRLPPLRQREDDIVLLAHHFLQHFNTEHGVKKEFSSAALSAIRAHDWPGNVRELRNHVYRSYILADTVIDAEVEREAHGAARTLHEERGEISVSIGSPLADANRQLILATLEQCGGSKKLAAEMLGISLKTLYNRLEEYNALSEPESGVSESSSGR